MMIVVPFCVLINDFIAMWVGAEYILPASVVMLLVHFCIKKRPGSLVQ